MRPMRRQLPRRSTPKKWERRSLRPGPRREDIQIRRDHRGRRRPDSQPPGQLLLLHLQARRSQDRRDRGVLRKVPSDGRPTRRHQGRQVPSRYRVQEDHSGGCAARRSDLRALHLQVALRNRQQLGPLRRGDRHERHRMRASRDLQELLRLRYHLRWKNTGLKFFFFYGLMFLCNEIRVLYWCCLLFCHCCFSRWMNCVILFVKYVK